MNVESDFCETLTSAGVRWSRLDTSSAIEAEQRWRDIYGQAFVGRSRARTGVKAEHEFRVQKCTGFLIVPFTSGVNGLPIHVLRRCLGAYECHGPLVDLARFHNEELFVSPFDYDWTMVYTHEDHASGGPYFYRRDWISAD